MKVFLFSNDGCGSCKKWKPLFEKLMKEYGLEYELVNMYDPKNKELREKYGVSGIPDTIFTDDDGNEIGHVLGNMLEELARKQIEYYISKCR